MKNDHDYPRETQESLVFMEQNCGLSPSSWGIIVCARVLQSHTDTVTRCHTHSRAYTHSLPHAHACLSHTQSCSHPFTPWCPLSTHLVTTATSLSPCCRHRGVTWARQFPHLQMRPGSPERSKKSDPGFWFVSRTNWVS